MEHEPIFGHGKICYVEIPSRDVTESAKFYHHVFGWKIQHREDGSHTFDDPVGCVSGMWVLGAPPATEPRIIISIMVFDAEKTLKDIEANDGKVVEPIGKHYPVITALFSDPTGNVWQIYQHG